MSVIGARNSCEASAVNCRVRVNEAGEHVVQRLGELLQLVVRVGHREARREVALADGTGLVGDARHGREGPPAQPYTAGDRHERDDRHREPQHRGERPEHALELALRIRDADHERLARNRHRLPGDAHAEVGGTGGLVSDPVPEVAGRLQRHPMPREALRLRDEPPLRVEHLELLAKRRHPGEAGRDRLAAALPRRVEESAQPDEAVAQALVERAVERRAHRPPVPHGREAADDGDGGEVPEGQPDPQRAPAHSGCRRP
jgi:hypothetical protein